MTDIEITTRLRVPHAVDIAYFPAAWAQDTAISHAASGLLAHVLSLVDPNDPVYTGDLPNNPADVAALPGLIAELVEAGYLVPGDDGGDTYELVNPDRLPPWPGESP